MSAPGRSLATFAVGFLLLDAVLLVWLGLDLKRPALVVGGGLCALGAAAVVAMWRRFQRTLADVSEGRREMKEEAEAIRRLLKERHLQN